MTTGRVLLAPPAPGRLAGAVRPARPTSTPLHPHAAGPTTRQGGMAPLSGTELSPSRGQEDARVVNELGRRRDTVVFTFFSLVKL